MHVFVNLLQGTMVTKFTAHNQFFSNSYICVYILRHLFSNKFINQNYDNIRELYLYGYIIIAAIYYWTMNGIILCQ